MNIIKLNVSDVFFTSTKETLQKSAYFQELFLKNPEKNEFLIEKNPQNFKIILNYLRGISNLSILSNNIENDLNFFGIKYEKKNNNNQIIKIKVCEKEFITKRSTLTSQSKYFETLLSGKFGDSTSEIFIEKNPQNFEIILNYLRGNLNNINFTYSLIQDFDYFEIAYEKLLPSNNFIVFNDDNIMFSSEFTKKQFSILSNIFKDDINFVDFDKEYLNKFLDAYENQCIYNLSKFCNNYLHNFIKLSENNTYWDKDKFYYFMGDLYYLNINNFLRKIFINNYNKFQQIIDNILEYTISDMSFYYEQYKYFNCELIAKIIDEKNNIDIILLQLHFYNEKNKDNEILLGKMLKELIKYKIYK